MRLASKRLLYTVFFLLFFIATPLITLYATGYRYNFKKNKIEKTGTLIIETKPKNSLIYLNDELIKQKTPAKINNLLPDKYLVKVENEGYYPWSKKLVVQSGLTTFAKKITLFKKNLPALKIKGEIEWLEVIPGRDKFIYLLKNSEKKYIKMFEPSNLEGTTLYETRNLNSQLATQGWSSNNKKLLVLEMIDDINDFLIINTESNQTEKISDVTKLMFEQLKWDQENNNIIFGYRKNVLYQIDLLNKITRPVLAAQLDDLLGINQTIYYIYKSSNNSYLVKKKLADNLETIIKLPDFSTYVFKPSYNNILIIGNAINEELYIINKKIFDRDQNIEKYLDLNLKAKNVVWSEDRRDLILYNNFEIWTYNLEANESNLVTRYGQEIKNALWHPSKDYLIYQLENSVHIIELDPREFINQYELAKFEEIRDMFVDLKGENIYILGKIGSQEGIFELGIK